MYSLGTSVAGDWELVWRVRDECIVYSLGTSVSGDWELVWQVRERVYCV